MLKFRSNNNIVIAPASTGKDSNNKINVINILHKYNLSRDKLNTFERLITIVVIILIAPIIEDNPAKWSAKIQ